MPEKIRSVRISDPIWQQLEDLTKTLQLVPELGVHGTLTMSTVLRLAVVEGLEVLRRKYPSSASEAAHRVPS
jgi:hypothetical protein